MFHLAPNTKSRIISKGISTGNSKNSYRGLVKIGPRAFNTKNYSQCDSLLIGKNCSANTFPYVEVQNSYTKIEHEASTSRIAEEQLFYLLQRGINPEEAISLMVNGFCKEVFNELPLEFATEADRLLSLKLEGSVG
jgi:Fe-S cluster assembly protein SufB